MNERRAFFVAVVAIVVVLWAVRSILAPFIVASGLAYAFAPLVTAAERRTRWPRPAIVGVGYVVVLAAIGLLGYVAAERLISELRALSANGPDLVASALRQIAHADSIAIGGTTISMADLATAVHGAIAGVAGSPGGALDLAKTVLDVLLQTILVLIVTFYLLVDGRRIRDWTLELVPSRDRDRAAALLDRVQDVLSKWLRGQLVLIVLVTVVVYLFLGPVLHVRYAAAIAVLTGILEVIPLVGPIIAAAIAVVAALVAGGTGTALIVAVGYFVLRQVEDQAVMPVVIGRAVHLHPVVTIFAVLAGLTLYGVLGGLLGVPVAAAVNVIFNDLYRATATVEPPTVSSPPTLSAE